MARRMFSDGITTSDAFLDMPAESQLLYFHLGMNADDDGFIANTKMVQRIIGAGDDSLKILFAKKFLIAFDNGVCVMKHWRINNYIRKDIYKETKYIDQKRQLFIRENGAYSMRAENAIPLPAGHFTLQDKFGKDVENVPGSNFVDEPSTERARSGDVGKVRKGKVSVGKGSKDTILFDEFWKLYPNKAEKKKSEAKWNALPIETQRIILEDLPKRKLGEKWSKDGGRFVEMPTTYLNGERWNDEIVPAGRGAQKGPTNVLPAKEDKYAKYDK